jgi:hypothetical protein
MENYKKWKQQTITVRQRYSDILPFILIRILGVFAKLRKATICLIMSVCPSVCMEQLGSHWTDFHEM